MLSRWNRKINLTALSDPDEAIDRLLLEPLAALAAPARGHHSRDGHRIRRRLPGYSSQIGGAARGLDHGRGQGAQVGVSSGSYPPSHALSETQVENARYEELLARPELHERFDVLTIRAVRVQPKTLMSLQAFVRPLGTLMLFRGAEGGREPESLVPALTYEATVPLLEATQSRLTLLSKRPIGH